jgi:hypothetical protein
MATETVKPPETNGRTPHSDEGKSDNSRAWHEWLAVGVGREHEREVGHRARQEGA